MYKKILVAIDESERGFKALEHAMNLANCLTAKLFVLYVNKPSIDQIANTALDIVSIEEKISNKIPLTADELWYKVNSCFPQIKKQASFISRKRKNIAKTIVDVAKDKDCDLIVLGSRKLPGASSIILRSVTNEVLSMGDKAVLVVR